MHIALLLNRSFVFPLVQGHFPLSEYMYAWLEIQPQNRITIIAPTHIHTDNYMSGKLAIIFIKPLSGRSSFWSDLFYVRSVRKHLKRMKPQCVVYDGMDTWFLFHRFNLLKTRINNSSVIFLQSYNRSARSDVSYLKHSVQKKELYIKYLLNHVIVGSSRGQLNMIRNFFPDNQQNRIVCLPDLPDRSFVPADEKIKSLVKQTVSNDSEYFICTAVFHDKTDLIFLLRAFSVLKKRLRTGIKLLLTCIDPGTQPDLVKQINQYRYKSDLCLLAPDFPMNIRTLISASYAHIFPAPDLIYPSGIWETVKAGVPVIVPQNYFHSEDFEDCFLYFDADSIEDLADKMMIMYKDEGLRKKMINQSLQKEELLHAECSIAEQLDAIFRS